MNLYRNTFHKYISIIPKQLDFFRVSAMFQHNIAMHASISQPVWQSSLVKQEWKIDRKKQTVGLTLALLIQKRKYMTNRAFCYLQQLPYHVRNPTDKTQRQCNQQNGSINKWTGIIMSQSFSMRIGGFIVNISSPYKLSIAFWSYFDLPSQLMLSNPMQVPVYLAQIGIFIPKWSSPSAFAGLQAATS